MNHKCVLVFVDGACRGNGRANAVAGIGVYFAVGLKHRIKHSEQLPHDIKHTNSTAELYAVKRAVEIAYRTCPRKITQIIICTDSMYVCKTFTEWLEKWKRLDRLKDGSVKNVELILEVKKLIDECRMTVQILHIERWSKQDEQCLIDATRIADELAKDATKI
jgi:ribonuclease HI